MLGDPNRDTDQDYEEGSLQAKWKELREKNFERKPGHPTPKGYVEDRAAAGPAFKPIELINPAGLFKPATEKKEWTKGTARDEPPLLLNEPAPEPRPRVVKSRFDSAPDTVDQMTEEQLVEGLKAF